MINNAFLGMTTEQLIQTINSIVENSGVTIQSITQTTTSIESNGENIITCVLSDGSTQEFVIKNGSAGASQSFSVTGTKLIISN